MKCDHCRGERDPDHLLCPTCGALSETRRPECENHGDVSAIACCTVCGKPVCGDCATRAGVGFFCDTGEHQMIAGEWTVVADCTSVFEGEMVARNLQQAGFETRMFNRSDHVSAVLFRVPEHVHVRVRNKDVQPASECLADLALDEQSRAERTTEGP